MNGMIFLTKCHEDISLPSADSSQNSRFSICPDNPACKQTQI